MAHRMWIGWGLAATVGIVTLTDVALAQTRFSGTVVSVAPDGAAIAFEELGVAGQVVRRMITLAPDARVVHVTRASENGEFIEQPAQALDLRAGDFVTVTIGSTTVAPDSRGWADPAGRVEARVIEIVRETGEAAASPR